MTFLSVAMPLGRNRRCRFQKGGSRGQAIERPNQGEDEGGDGGEKPLVVTEEDSQGFGNGADELPVREGEQELFVQVFGKQEGTFLGTGRAEVETFTGKRTKILESAFGIAALMTGAPTFWPRARIVWRRRSIVFVVGLLYARAMQNIAIVTGANTGMGKETARELARLGMQVVLACRNRQKAETACAELVEDTGSSAIEVMELDLASRTSVRSFVQAFTAGHPRLDVLVNNGGVSPTELSRVDGIETTIATNHLGPFLLTNLLLDMLKASAPSRVVTVSSVMHKRARFDLSDFDGTRNWSSFDAYNNSKLLNVLFTAELSRRLAGTGVTATCLNPGLVKSDFFRHYARPPIPSEHLARPYGHDPRPRGAYGDLVGLLRGGRGSDGWVLREVPRVHALRASPRRRTRPARVGGQREALRVGCGMTDSPQA